MARDRIVILGAAGRDFHNFNTLYRNNDRYEVVAFTAAQIPDIDGRKYPSKLAGKLYPKGIPIYDEKELLKLIAKHEIDETKTGPREAGAVKSVGQGGETIWRESLMPDEKAVLKRYFK